MTSKKNDAASEPLLFCLVISGTSPTKYFVQAVQHVRSGSNRSNGFIAAQFQSVIERSLVQGSMFHVMRWSEVSPRSKDIKILFKTFKSFNRCASVKTLQRFQWFQWCHRSARFQSVIEKPAVIAAHHFGPTRVKPAQARSRTPLYRGEIALGSSSRWRLLSIGL